MPDKPIVLKPIRNIALLPGNTIQLYFKIPVNINFISETDKFSILEEPIKLLPNTWAGDTETGEACYQLDAELYEKPPISLINNYEIICPVKIKNNSREILNLLKIFINVEYLSIYFENGLLWSNELEVSFKGMQQQSSINYFSKPPKELENPTKLSEPKVPIHHSFFKKSFEMLKLFTGLKDEIRIS